MDEALRRGERYLRAGADGLFLEAPLAVEEMGRITRELPAVHVANMLEGGRTPLLPPAELDRLGFRILLYGISLLMHAAKAMRAVLEDVALGEFRLRGQGVGVDEYKRIVGFGRWDEVEERYGGR